MLILLLTCPLCHGRKTVGDHGPSVICPRCEGAGDIRKEPAELTWEERNQALADIRLHEDPASAYDRERTCDRIMAMLTGFRVTSVSFPEDQPTEIHITNSRGVTLSIQPEHRSGAFHHLTIIPVPP